VPSWFAAGTLDQCDRALSLRLCLPASVAWPGCLSTAFTAGVLVAETHVALWLASQYSFGHFEYESNEEDVIVDYDVIMVRF
jgi:hypothetical protein